MTVILGERAKRSLYTPDKDLRAWAIEADQDIQRLYIALRPSLVVNLTDASTIATDAFLSFHYRVTLAGNRTLGNPTNARDGIRVVWEIHQDSTGSRTLSYGSQFSFSDDLPSITLSTAADAVDFIGAVCC